MQLQLGSDRLRVADGTPAVQLLDTERMVVGGHGAALTFQSAGLLLPSTPLTLMLKAPLLNVSIPPATLTLME